MCFWLSLLSLKVVVLQIQVTAFAIQIGSRVLDLHGGTRSIMAQYSTIPHMSPGHDCFSCDVTSASFTVAADSARASRQDKTTFKTRKAVQDVGSHGESGWN
mmetsp:Transcript_5062/g.14988  ORF Transcript_5062/g.14988 Transcript_5062/m.14988 type:complete len:102 (-) Transcript_5062:456-761(-)